MNIVKIIIYSLLLWTPRILCILFVAINLFLVNVFGQKTDLWVTPLPLLSHLILTFLILIILILSWWWAWIGGISYVLLGFTYMIWSSYNREVLTHSIYVPLFLIGIFFLLSWFFRKEINKAQATYWRGRGEGEKWRRGEQGML